ncbi:MAG: hypothetical protein SFV19_20220 [Rhodospirillaceae bacterium]|nr:hypothetical protein [Rhodospirillaceae bacterium]
MPRHLPTFAYIAWLAVAALGVGLAAAGAVVPPAWDALSYLAKAQSFWTAVAQGGWFNPLDLEPAVRPPATILMSYPLGFSPDFRWFYFRSVVLPMVLLGGAIYVAASARDPAPRARSGVAVLAVAAGSMPMLFQFQPNAEIESQVSWGMVDGFLAGLAALATACALRGARERSVAWSVAAALVAALCFMTKPVGGLIMALVGLSWLVLVAQAHDWRWARLRAAPGGLAHVLASATLAAAIMGGAFVAAIRSDYLSLENLAFADRVFAVLQNDILTPVSPALMAHLIGVGPGYVMSGLTVLGLIAALAGAASRGHGWAAAACLGVGIWFWFFQTEAAEIRYFVPFVVMAFVLVAPSLLTGLERLDARAAAGVMAVAMAPGAIVAVLLLAPSAPVAWQRALGINLDANMYAPEVAQARGLLAELKTANRSQAVVYLHIMSQPTRAFQGTIDHARLVEPGAPQVTMFLPIDWQRPSAYRFDELIVADFIAFEPVADAARREALLARRAVANIYDQVAVLQAWFTTLGPDDGVSVVSQTHLTLLRLENPAKFDAAWARLEQAHDWPAAFVAANPRRWWSRADATAEPGAADAALTFARGLDPVVAVTVPVIALPAPGAPTISVWLAGAEALAGTGSWYIFAHALDAQGALVGNAQRRVLAVPAPDPDQNLRRYDLTFSGTTAGAAAYGLGVFRLDGGQIAEMLMVTGAASDMEGRRAVFKAGLP